MNKKPAIWMFTLFGGLSQLSESLYSPGLPDIAREFACEENLVQMTMMVFLFAFACGVLFWGRLSDRIGRKPCLSAGLLLFALGSLACGFAPSIYWLIAARFVQAFGASVGSVIMQAIARDAFVGAELSRVYSVTAAALAVFPALGPVVGGLIVEHTHWQWGFFLLSLWGFAACLSSIRLMPETHQQESRQAVSLLAVFGVMLRDPKVLAAAGMIAGCNGIVFGYLAEGPFFQQDMLGLSESYYGASFLAIATCTALGGLYAKRLASRLSVFVIMRRGSLIMVTSQILLNLSVFVLPLSKPELSLATILCMMMVSFGVCMVTSQVLSIALSSYKWCVGTASSLFGSLYYVGISLVTLLIAALHDDTLRPMPLLFLALASAVLFLARSVQQLELSKQPRTS